ncbi:prolyl oligopeptidase family serine peptidase [Tumidithrix elongata RA019]|uniref:Prolyl oligopeptidase family serine peptidase n=1 Tax=Tumidithrix elongata BACA0141 TaxID=2716417 RepID=A0AAW9PXS9_9CYAN|nr:prolyl oligopeptidase family serine peptidase [Tumidithrix elongata RA019]
MTTPQSNVTSYGSWKSPITSDLIVAGTVGLGQLAFDGKDLYWLEARPSEGGRNVIVRYTSDGNISDVTPAPFNVRARVHEYGGGSFWVHNSSVYFINFSDQRIYQQVVGDRIPTPLTPLTAFRYADGIYDRFRGRLICVQEDHTAGGEPVNTLVSINLTNWDDVQVLASGADFYASPRLSADGKQLAWLSWNHPNMPWDGTELWVAEIIPTEDRKATGAHHNSLQNALNHSSSNNYSQNNLREHSFTSTPKLVAGGVEESIFQPEWSPDGTLCFVSDRTGWWNLYRWSKEGTIEPLCPMEAEFGLPQWVFGMSTYAFVSAERLICSYTQKGRWYLATLDLSSKSLQPLDTPYTQISGLQATKEKVAFLAGSPTQATAIVQINLSTGKSQILRCSSDLAISASYISIPEAVEFPTENGLTAYGFFYPPQNPDYQAPDGEKPPLIVKSHGGPTASTSDTLSLKIQYWTSRGFAVLDVNYGGSTGYGRPYRQRLKFNWGVVDVDDCANGAKYLAERGLVDWNRLAIAGGSAGGYTTLCALTFRDVFKAGASYYGVSDLEALATDTHKFESRYLDSLIGAYPEFQDLYRQRSPIHFTDRLSCPVIFFQGLEDRVVPPNQAEMMVDALKAKGLPVAYVPFEGEQHGFRKAENIKRTLDGELYFYAKVFGFPLGESVEPVEIENLF